MAISCIWYCDDQDFSNYYYVPGAEDDDWGLTTIIETPFNNRVDKSDVSSFCTSKVRLRGISPIYPWLLMLVLVPDSFPSSMAGENFKSLSLSSTPIYSVEIKYEPKNWIKSLSSLAKVCIILPTDGGLRFRTAIIIIALQASDMRGSNPIRDSWIFYFCGCGSVALPEWDKWTALNLKFYLLTWPANYSWWFIARIDALNKYELACFWMQFFLDQCPISLLPPSIYSVQ